MEAEPLCFSDDFEGAFADSSWSWNAPLCPEGTNSQSTCFYNFMSDALVVNHAGNTGSLRHNATFFSDDPN